MKAPVELDGAKVILYVENMPTNNFGYSQYEDHRETITSVAITNYDGSSEYYVFDCDINWNVIGDSVHSSLEEALEYVENSCDINNSQWVKAE